MLSTNMELNIMAKLITLTGASIALIATLGKFRMESHKDTGHLRLRPTDRVVSKDLTEITVSGEGDDKAATAVIPGRYFEQAEAKGVTYENGEFHLIKNANQWLEVLAEKPAEGEVLGTLTISDADEPVVPEKPKRGRKPKAEGDKAAEGTEAPAAEGEQGASEQAEAPTEEAPAEEETQAEA